MKDVSPAMAASLSGEVTTLCHCWKLVRTDGVILGFTDHDRNLVFDGLTYEAASGFLAGDMEHGLGMNIDSQQVSGALSSPRIDAADIRADRYDGARVEVWLVDWLNIEARMLDRVLRLGEISQRDGAFSGELLSLSADMDETRGRRFSRSCDAALGDSRCGVDLSLPAWSASVEIVEVRNATLLMVNGLASFAPDWFRGGFIRFETGDAEGLRLPVADHRHIGNLWAIRLWKPSPILPRSGDHAVIEAGCDKIAATCRSKFANLANFRGFPHMPGSDFAFGYVSSLTVMDGGPLVE